MKEIVISVEEDDYQDLMDICDINKKYLSENALEILGWNDPSVFFTDLLRYGLGAATEDPLQFIKEMLDSKLPVFKKEVPKEMDKKKKFEEEVKKAYN